MICMDLMLEALLDSFELFCIMKYLWLLILIKKKSFENDIFDLLFIITKHLRHHLYRNCSHYPLLYSFSFCSVELWAVREILLCPLSIAPKLRDPLHCQLSDTPRLQQT